MKILEITSREGGTGAAEAVVVADVVVVGGGVSWKIHQQALFPLMNMAVVTTNNKTSDVVIAFNN